MGRAAFDDNTAYIWRSNRQTAEERLLIAILNRAWMDATKPLYMMTKKGPAINPDTQSAYDWFLSDETDMLTFIWVLDALAMTGMKEPIRAQVLRIIDNTPQQDASPRP